MLSTEVDSPEGSSQIETGSTESICIHCGLPVPETRKSSARQKSFCCNGCEVAYAILHEDDELIESWQARPASEWELDFHEFDHPSFQEVHSRELAENLRETQLQLSGIYCFSCLFAIEKLPRFLSGVREARVNMASSRVTLIWDPEQISLSSIAHTLHRVGYRPFPLNDQQQEIQERNENRQELIRLAVAGACAGNAMLLALALYHGLFLGMASEFRVMFELLGMGIALISLVWPGRVFFLNAWRAIKNRTPHMDLPVALGLGAGGAMGFINALLGHGEIYFDSITVLVFLLLTGRYLQHLQQRRAVRQVSLLRALTPQSARKIDGWNTGQAQIRSVPIDTIVVDDVLEVRAGDLFPVDGVVLKGNSTVDESIMTGESREIPVSVDSPVIAGTKNISGLLIIRAQQVAQQTRLAEMMRLVESGVASKTPIVQLANAIGGYFVVVVMLLALITLGIWWSSGIHLAVNHAMALLIVACPCALGLATPLTIAIAQARAARRQILIKSGEVFERLRQSGEIWIDKTGTITEGRLRLAEWQGSEKYLPYILAMERQAIHPIALALVNHFESRSQPIEEVILEEVTLQPGVGLWSCTSAGVLHVGSSILLETQAESAAAALSETMREYQARGWSIVVAVLDGELVAVFGFTDSIRPDAATAISTLRLQGWQPGILSGDHQRAVDLVAEQIGIPPERACGQVTPEGKLERIRLATEASSVIMVGDGVNDSAALAAASVGIAVCGGASASLQAADVYLNRPGLAEIPQLIAGVRTTGRVIRLNFGISLVYNALAAGLAIAGQINPVIAAILMPVSSLTVLSVAFFNPAFGKSDS